MKLKKKTIIIIASVILLAVIGITLFLLLGNKGPEMVKISFNTNGGNSVESLEIEKGKTISLPLCEKEGFTLEGWYANDKKVSNDTTYMEDTELKAKWVEKTTKTFKISFDTDGGNKIKDVVYECDKKIELQVEPTKKGYTFVKWETKEGKEVVDGDLLACEDIILYAKWEKEKPKTYKVTFDSKGGSKVSAVTVECDKKLTLPKDPVRTDYTFVSWVDKNGKTILNGAQLSCEDITLYAEWKKVETKTFKVTFDSKGGSSVSAVTVECDKKLTLPKAPTRDGYTFVKWVDKNNKEVADGAVLACEDITLSAEWKEVEKAPSTPEPTPKPEETPKEYTCTEGTLSGDKCKIEGTVRETCPEGTTADGSLCIKTSDSNGGTRQCKSYTVSIDGKGHTQTLKGDYYMVGNSYGKCAYYKWTDYTTKDQCTSANDINHKTTWVSELNACYAETYITFPSGESSYETVCSSDYQYYSSEQLSSKFGIHDNAKCLKKVNKTKYCDENYTLTNGKCIKTVDAILK